MEIHTDGWTHLGNPSPKGGGYTLVAVEYSEQEGVQTRVLKQEEYERPGFTSNQGEIRGLIAALELAQQGDVIVVDSMNSLWWLFRGKFSARPDLDTILIAAKKLAQEKKAAIKNMQPINEAEIIIEWRGRDQNEAGKFNELFH